MKRTTYIYLLIFALLLIAAIFIMSQNRSGTIPQALQDFAVPDTENVTKIFLADRKGNHVELERQGPGVWMVNNKFKAFDQHIKILLETIKLVEVKNPISIKAKSNYLKEMLVGSTKVEIYKNGQKEPAKIYSVGGTTPDMLGTIMLLHGSTTPFVTWIPGFDGFLSSRFFTSEREWRTRDLYALSPASINELEYDYPSTPDKSFHFISEEGSKFTVAPARNPKISTEVRPKLAKSLLIGFGYIEFESFYEGRPAQADSIIASVPVLNISIKANGKPLPGLKLYSVFAEGSQAMAGRSPIDPGRYLAIQSNSPKEIVFIQKRNVLAILKTYQELAVR
jgi:hypothetical protein